MVAETLLDSSTPAPIRSASRPGLWPDMIDSLTPRLLRAYDGYAEVDVPVLQSNSSSFTHMDHGKESFVGLQSFVDLIYLRDSATNELVAGDMRRYAHR